MPTLKSPWILSKGLGRSPTVKNRVGLSHFVTQANFHFLNQRNLFSHLITRLKIELFKEEKFWKEEPFSFLRFSDIKIDFRMKPTKKCLTRHILGSYPFLRGGLQLGMSLRFQYLSKSKTIFEKTASEYEWGMRRVFLMAKLRNISWQWQLCATVQRSRAPPENISVDDRRNGGGPKRPRNLFFETHPMKTTFCLFFRDFFYMLGWNITLCGHSVHNVHGTQAVYLKLRKVQSRFNFPSVFSSCRHT